MRRLLVPLLVLMATGALAQDSPQALVDRAIAHAGGWKAWDAVRSVEFRKTSSDFAPDGSVTRTQVQIHRYERDPLSRMRIEYEEEGASVVLINDGEQAWKIVDGKVGTTPADTNSARNSTFGAHCVFGMPFKLRCRRYERRCSRLG